MKSPDQQFAEILTELLYGDGRMVENARTGLRTLTSINHVMTYNLTDNRLPLLMTKKVPWKMALAELLGYLNGFSNAEDFNKMGTNTWYANANKTRAWLDNPHRKGENDLGEIYGRQWYSFHGRDGLVVNQVEKVIHNLANGIDDRGEIITAWHPAEHELGALRPCLHSWQFSAVDGWLYVTAIQRSADVGLGVPFNMAQVGLFAHIMARLTGLKAAKATHVLVNTHVYENHLAGVREQLRRCTVGPTPTTTGAFWPRVVIDESVQTLGDLCSFDATSLFSVENYNPMPAIKMGTMAV